MTCYYYFPIMVMLVVKSRLCDDLASSKGKSNLLRQRLALKARQIINKTPNILMNNPFRILHQKVVHGNNIFWEMIVYFFKDAEFSMYCFFRGQQISCLHINRKFILFGYNQLFDNYITHIRLYSKINCSIENINLSSM